MIWKCIKYKVIASLFVAKHNPLPKNYQPEVEWEPLWTQAGVEAYAHQLNERLRGVRVEEVLAIVVENLGIESLVSAMTIKSENEERERSIWYRYYIDPKNKRNAVRLRVELSREDGQ